MCELRSRVSTAIAHGRRDAPAAAHVTAGFALVGDWMPWLDQAGSLLGAAERARVLRMKRPADAAARTLAYALHRLFLGASLGVDAHDVPLSRDGLGCPVLDDDWRTSLSHADGAFAFAVVRDAPVGIDLERLDRVAGIGDIEAEICGPGESAALAGLPAEERARALLDLWARKEAYLKASGIGLQQPMASFPLPDGAIRHLAARAAATEVETGMVALHPGYVAAVSRPPGMPVDVVRLRPA